MTKRFEMMTVINKKNYEDEPFKDVLIDGLTGEQYEDVNNLVDLLNDLWNENNNLRKQYTECEKFRHYVFENLGRVYDEKNLL